MLIINGKGVRKPIETVLEIFFQFTSEKIKIAEIGGGVRVMDIV